VALALMALMTAARFHTALATWTLAASDSSLTRLAIRAAATGTAVLPLLRTLHTGQTRGRSFWADNRALGLANALLGITCAACVRYVEGADYGAFPPGQMSFGLSIASCSWLGLQSCFFSWDVRHRISRLACTVGMPASRSPPDVSGGLLEAGGHARPQYAKLAS